MSDNKNNGSFEAAPWGAADQTRKTGGASTNGAEAFKALYSDEKRDNPQPEAFVASFVSEEKARELAKNKKSEPATESGHESLEEIERRVYDKAYSEGLQAGQEEGRKQSQAAVDRLQEIVTNMEAAWANLVQTHEAQIIQLLYRVVEKVVYGQAAVEQEMVKRAILEALRVIPEPVNVEIAVNPKDYEYIDTIKEDFFSHIKALKDVSVTSDPSIHSGGCHVKTKFGEVDATLENRLEAIRKSLLTANGGKV